MRAKPLALIIDDEQAICESLGGVVSDEGWDVVSANSGKDGIQTFISSKPDLVLVDVWMRGMDGIEVLQKIKELQRDIPVLIMSGHATIDTAVRAVKLGAFDYMEKPLSLEKIVHLLEHANNRRMLHKQDSEDRSIPYRDLIGTSVSIQKIRELIRLVSPKNAWTLITGENGTGKEVVAQLIHRHSSRAKNAFVAINCAAIPNELIESELFGYEKGAFTNALSRKIGKFELANHGTLFLDEIADMSLVTQAKILRILQEQSFERVGGNETLHVDVRVVAATNKNLEQEIKSGRFREDLFYRLNVVPIHLPPLRERGADILALADYFLDFFSQKLGEKPMRLSLESCEVLRRYPWPGNVRELKNVIERLCILSASEEIGVSDLPEHILNAVPYIDRSESERNSSLEHSYSTLREARTEFERDFILNKLEEFDWNVSRTAEAIGVERSNLHKKIKSFGIDARKLKE